MKPFSRSGTVCGRPAEQAPYAGPSGSAAVLRKGNITWHPAAVTREKRELKNGHRSFILWFTGLSGSGKSTLAHALEARLHRIGCSTFVFDGDNVRHGLNSDLGFSLIDRRENVRRIGEMCRLFLDAGVIALTAFISPMRDDRERVRRLIGEGDFIEIYCECDLGICERRDVKGLYAKARKGVIGDFTGISSPYEEPEDPQIHLNTGLSTVAACMARIMDYIIGRDYLRTGSAGRDGRKHAGMTKGYSR